MHPAFKKYEQLNISFFRKFNILIIQFNMHDIFKYVFENSHLKKLEIFKSGYW